MNYNELSKEISYALRHAPQEYGLTLDREGWVDTQQLLESLITIGKWKNLCELDLHKMIKLSSKQRHEIKGNKIRAYYGHSSSIQIKKDEKEPPEFLFHGTTKKAALSIMQKGLKPQQRQYVHLSQDLGTAIEVGKRRENTPTILLVKAKDAFENGISFYSGNDRVWLSDEIPTQYIDIYKSTT